MKDRLEFYRKGLVMPLLSARDSTIFWLNYWVSASLPQPISPGGCVPFHIKLIQKLVRLTLGVDYEPLNSN